MFRSNDIGVLRDQIDKFDLPIFVVQRSEASGEFESFRKHRQNEFIHDMRFAWNKRRPFAVAKPWICLAV